jgi:hypothetical protein
MTRPRLSSTASGAIIDLDPSTGTVRAVLARRRPRAAKRDYLVDDADMLISLLLEHGETLASIAARLARRRDGRPGSFIGQAIIAALILADEESYTGDSESVAERLFSSSG